MPRNPGQLSTPHSQLRRGEPLARGEVRQAGREAGEVRDPEDIRVGHRAVLHHEQAEQLVDEGRAAVLDAGEVDDDELAIVAKGDNLYKISRRYYGTDRYVPAIIKLNHLKDANTITHGQKLRLP